MKFFDKPSREEPAALWQVIKHRPEFTLLIAVFGVATAFLEGIGLSFILPIVEFARSPGVTPDTSGGLMGLFINVYAFFGIPFTFEYVIVGLIAVMAVRYGATIAMEWFRILLRMDYERYLKTELLERALDTSISYFDNRGSDEILNAIITQANEAGFVINQIVQLTKQSMLSLMYFAVALYVAPVLTAITIVILGGITYLVRFNIKPGQIIGSRLADANEEIQTAAQAGTQGIREVKLFGMEDLINQRFSNAVENRVAASTSRTRNQAIIDNLYQFLSAITVFGLIYVGLTIASLSLGSLGVFLFAMFRLAPRASRLNKLVYNTENSIPHLVRTQDFIDELKQHEEGSKGSETPPDPITEIRFDGVSFAYNDSNLALENISFSVERGGLIAFVGPSGAGKSTIVSLLARMYQPDSGTITANGRPIEEFDLQEWRSKLALVRQNPFIFNDTLRFNLTLGKQDTTQEELNRVCEIAQITEFLDELPDQFETVLGDDGVKLSGGQRQRVALARALLKNADVLLLDEATSDLDTGTEQKVQRSIEAMERDRVVITIAHRLSTVRNADRIHTVESGKIVEVGSHEELIADNGTYSQLYAVQHGGDP